MLISTALLLDSIIRNSVCTPAKLPCRRVEVGYEESNKNPRLRLVLLFDNNWSSDLIYGCFRSLAKNFPIKHFALGIYSEFFLRLAIGFYMLIFQPPVNFCSDKNIQTIFGIKLEDFLNYRIDYNLISQTVEKVVKKYFLGRRNNSTSSGRQSSAIVGSTIT
jgi:hypothetical protein